MLFNSANDIFIIWKYFLPQDYVQFISRSNIRLETIFFIGSKEQIQLENTFPILGSNIARNKFPKVQNRIRSKTAYNVNTIVCFKTESIDGKNEKVNMNFSFAYPIPLSKPQFRVPFSFSSFPFSIYICMSWLFMIT